MRKVFLSRKAEADHIGKASPGPVYNLKSSVGTQVQSHNESAPSFMFGKKTNREGDATHKAPGPGRYVTVTCTFHSHTSPSCPSSLNGRSEV